MTLAVDARELALQEANRVRMMRGNARKVMTRTVAAEIAEDPPEWAESWKVGSFLRTVPGIGVGRQVMICRRLLIGEGRKLVELTPGQRARLVATLDRSE